MTRPVIEQKIVLAAIRLGVQILRHRQQATKAKRKARKVRK
jgi:hypothetical protein